jgi:RsiW-degrading membrane proteinase PrsW (M82 family)
LTGLAITVPAAVVPSLVLLWYFHSKDKYPEPASVVWMTFGLGVLSIIPVLLMAFPMVLVLSQLGARDPYLIGISDAFLTAAVPEEACKLAVLLLYSARRSAFDEPMDGLVYGVAASLGFATLENILYVASGGLPTALARALTAVPGHAMLGAIMGYYVGQARFDPQRRRSLLLKAWAVPMLLHGLYDFPLITVTAMAKPGAELADEDQGAALRLVGMTIVVLIVEWVWAVRLARRLRALQDKQAGEKPGAGDVSQPAPPRAANDA